MVRRVDSGSVGGAAVQRGHLSGRWGAGGKAPRRDRRGDDPIPGLDCATRSYGMSLRSLLRPRGRRGPEGVTVRLRGRQGRTMAQDDGRAMPPLLRWVVLGASVFYLLAHFAVVQ